MIVGVLGGGQLARMMALAGLPLGMKFVFCDPAPDACAADAGELICASYDDATALAAFADKVDVATFDFENVPESSIQTLADRVQVFPSATALGMSQDRLREKNLFRQLGIPTADFAPVSSMEELSSAIAAMGLPAVLKTRRFGYDGKGQIVISSEEEVAPAWEAIRREPAIVERLVSFSREVSVIAVRAQSGEIAIYPLSENTHREGILRMAISRPGDAATHAASEMATSLLESLRYVGVLTLELFDTESGLVANEFAPRVHNSGHWTIEGAQTSQFENHLRAITGLPLGDTAALESVTMLNIVGEIPSAEEVLSVPGAHLHLYGKRPAAGRKVGHVTVRSSDHAVIDAALGKLSSLPGVG